MSKVDDELSRRLQRVERPVDGEGLFEALSRRRSHRERVRRVQAGLLAFAVLAGTAGGFLILRGAFDADKRNVGDGQRPAIANGKIVFSRTGDDGRFHLYSALPDGSRERQLTDEATNDTDPVVSPNGKTIAYVRELEKGLPVVATIPIAGGRIAWQSRDDQGAGDPTWSPDGSEVLFVGDHRGLYAVSSNGSDLRTVLTFTKSQIADPSWSADGSMIVFAAPDGSLPAGARPWWLTAVTADGKQSLANVPGSNEDARAPAWSPDGSLIAFLAPHGRGVGVFTVPASVGLPVGGEPSLIATAAHLEHDLTWAPDGSSLLVSDGDWIYQVDATLDGDPRDNFVQLVRGVSPSWQPIPAGSDPSPTSTREPSVSPEPEPDGRDIGFGFPVCQVSELTAQFDGEGVTDTAVVATRLADDGRCPSNVEEADAYVGIDVDQDGFVDGSYGPIACEVYYCRAFAAPDLDGDDGKRELLVVESAGSIVGLGIYALAAEPGSPGNTEVLRIHVGEPDLVQAGFVTGEPARLFIGGDEGWSYRLRCEDHGINRFIDQQRAFRPVDSTNPATINETTLFYWQGRLNVLDARGPEQSTSDDPLGPQPPELCGAPIPAI